MSLTTDPRVVRKPRAILRPLAPVADQPHDIAHAKLVLMRALAPFPDAWQAVVEGLQEIGAQPWPDRSVILGSSTPDPLIDIGSLDQKLPDHSH